MSKQPKTVYGSLLDTDIEQILNSTHNVDVHRTYEITLHTPLEDLNIPFLRNIEWTRNYNTSTGEDIRVMFIMDGAEYRRYIHTYKDQLEITISKYSGTYLQGAARYKFFILTNNADIKQDDMNHMTDVELKQVSPIAIEGQCVDRDLFSLNDINIDGIYKNTNLYNVICNEFLESLKSIDYGEGVPKISMDLREFDNDKEYGHITIPTGVRLLDLPVYLQYHDTFGIYNGSIGNFIQTYKEKKYYWIYPLLDVKQYDNNEYSLMFLHSNHRAVGTGGTTFYIDGKITKIVPEFNIAVLEQGQKGLVDTYNSLTYADPDNVYKSYRDIDNGKTLKGDIKTNLKTISTKEMRDGTNRTNYIGLTNNVYKERAKVLKKTMSTYQLTWNDADIDIIYPGMPCVFITENKDNGIVKLKGSVKATYQMYANDKKKTDATIIISVSSPDVFMDMEDYADMNVKSKKE